ncbi:hypothetical protein R6Q57_023088 [Mikania cordata]
MNGAVYLRQSTVEEKVPSEQLICFSVPLRFFPKGGGSMGRMTRRYWNINLKEMMEAGHGTRKWNPKMTPYISAKQACDLVFYAASRGKQFLIVDTKNKEADSVAWATIRAWCQQIGPYRNETS